MMDEEGNGQIPYLLVCPRDCQNHNNVLLLFRRLTPPNCSFIATKIWSRDTRKKKCCLWCVLYQSNNQEETSYLKGTQAKELRKELNTRKPIGGEIVDYEFHQNKATGETGWLFIWRNLACTHGPHFHKKDNIQTEELLQECMKTHRIKCTVIPGDGVGPELVYSVEEVFKAIDVPIDFESFFLSEVNVKLSVPLDTVTNSIQDNGVCLKGAVANPDLSPTGELQNLNMKLRRALDLFANVVHVKSLEGVRTRHTGIDCVIIREQTEGEYSALEHESVKGMVECLKIVTRKKSHRIAKFAFDYATKNNRKKVTAIHKANIMKLGDGLFLKSCEEMAQLYPKIKFEKMIIDNCTMQLVWKPQQFDVMVMPNLYGSILDNVAAGLVGGAGVVAGASFSSNCAVFEPGARHTFAEAVGKNVANPTAMLLCSVNLLQHLNFQIHSDRIRRAVEKVLKEGKVRTKDLGGQSTCQEFTYAVIHNL